MVGRVRCRKGTLATARRLLSGKHRGQFTDMDRRKGSEVPRLMDLRRFQPWGKRVEANHFDTRCDKIGCHASAGERDESTFCRFDLCSGTYTRRSMR